MSMHFRTFLDNSVDFSNPAGFTSLRLFNEVSALAPTERSKLERGVQWIAANAINCCLIGGAAVVRYVSSARPLTPDLDFLTSNISDVTLKAEGQGLSVYPMMLPMPWRGVTVEQFDIDFVDAESGSPQINSYVIATARREMIGGASIRVAQPEVLAIMKLANGREKDDNDAFMLLQSGTFTKAKYKQALQALRGAVDSSTLWSYSYLIPV